MTHRDEKFLNTIRRQPNCWWCGRRTPQGCDPAHILGVGSCGGHIDIPENVAALCWICHRVNSHNGRAPNAEDLFRCVAKRLGKTWQQCRQRVWDLIREPKRA